MRPLRHARSLMRSVAYPLLFALVTTIVLIVALDDHCTYEEVC